MAKNSVTEQIVAFNKDRDPERLRMKLRAIRTDPFVFLRGTCHLFYRNLPADPLLWDAPLAWLCGDLHFQNMGSYKGDNRLIYYDINDFDEAALGPCTWDLLRLLTSVLAARRMLKINEPEALALCLCFMNSYTETLAEGKARWVEREIADGMVKDLLMGLAGRTRQTYLDTRSEVIGRVRRLRLDGKKALPASEEQRDAVASFMKTFAASQPKPQFFKLLDVARRIAGTGSLGVDRFVMLVEGKGSPHANYLLDLKQAVGCSLVPFLKTKQPRWTDDAERVVAVQKRMQAVSQAFLHAVVMKKTPYILRGLQPSEDRVDLSKSQGKLRRLEGAVSTMGQVLAWDQLRSSGRRGAAIADELIAFASATRLKKGMIDLALQCARQVEADWKTYCESGIGLEEAPRFKKGIQNRLSDW
jgi:uncharacterized protein (DUF2252 family)